MKALTCFSRVFILFLAFTIGIYGMINADEETSQSVANSSFGISVRDAALIPGDFTGDGKVDLADVIAALQISAGAAANSFKSKADVNNDGKIGMEEVLYCIQGVAKLRVITIPPNAPTELLATANMNMVSLTWKDNSSDELGFKIERSDQSDSGFLEIDNTPPDRTTYNDEKATACGKTFYYRVTAHNLGGKSNYASANTTTNACLGVKSLQETFVSQGLPTDWQNPSTDKWVFNDPNNRKAIFKKSYPTVNTDALTFGLADSIYSNTPLTSELRLPVMNFSDTPSVKLSFNTFLSYSGGSADVEVSTDNGTTWEKVWSMTTPLLTFSIDKTSNTISFKQQTVDISNQVGGKSNVIIRFLANKLLGRWMINTVNVESLSKPIAPENLAAVLDKNSAVILTWQYKSDPKPEFQVQRSPDGSTWTVIGTIKTGETQYIDSSVESLKDYYYRVYGNNSVGLSAPSNTVTIKTADRSVVSYDVSISYYDTAANTLTNKKAAIENIIKNFADAVFEESNGTERLGRVTIYCDNKNNDKANIIWADNGWPHANISGYGKDGLAVFMYDVFANNGAPINFLQDDQGQKQAGYTLAHEWGHYFFSLYDEYAGTDSSSDTPNTPLKTDTPVPNSVMDNQWNAVNDLKWLNFSTSVDVTATTNQTAQYRIYQASAWDTLVRPVSDDPRDKTLNSMPIRLYHPELKLGAPASGQRPSIQIDQQANKDAAKQVLNIVWADQSTPVKAVTATSGFARMVVIDCSPRMSQTQLDDIKFALKGMIDRAKIGDTIGINAFSPSDSDMLKIDPVTNLMFAVKRLVPLTTINNLTDKSAIKTAIDGITYSPFSNIGEALDASIRDLETIPNNFVRSVYLITQGIQDSGIFDMMITVPAFQNEYIQLNVFGYGADETNSENLKAFAEQAYGNYYAISSREDLQQWLNSVDQSSSPVVGVDIKAGTVKVTSTTPQNITFYIDSTLSDFALEINYPAQQSSAVISLMDPSGNSVNVASDFCQTSTDDYLGISTTCTYIQYTPIVVGTWTLKAATTVTDELQLSYRIDAFAKQEMTTFTAEAQSYGGYSIEYPNPILITAFVDKDLPVIGLTVTGIVETPNGTIETITLRDDGMPDGCADCVDAVAQDGFYSGIYNPSMDGDYKIRIVFNNNDNKGQYSDKGLMFAVAPDGSSHASTSPVLVNENFERYAEIQVYYFGYQADDHGNAYDDNPTPLTTDNTPIPGRIDYAGDVDTFEITIPDNYSDDTFRIMVDEWGAGMIPVVTLYPQLTSIEPGLTFWIDVKHQDPTATKGTYSISAGPKLPSDPK